MPFFKYLDQYSDITDITFRDRARFAPMDKLSQRLMRGRSPFSSAEKEIIAAYVSGLNECNFCYGSHQAVAENFGISPETIEALLEDIDTADIADKMKPILHYVKKLTLTPSKLVQADVDRVLDAGWTEQALYDAICIGCLFNFYNRLLDGHGIKGNDNIYHLGGQHLHKNGYGVPWFIKYIKNTIRKRKVKQLQTM
ncbi:hypothetical protein BKI52_13170 [marine bacterium AO1-C]|nr:hypothetical protein BKI52_13170 [marine bacterium AO1-C]